MSWVLSPLFPNLGISPFLGFVIHSEVYTPTFEIHCSICFLISPAPLALYFQAECCRYGGALPRSFFRIEASIPYLPAVRAANSSQLFLTGHCLNHRWCLACSEVQGPRHCESMWDSSKGPVQLQSPMWVLWRSLLLLNYQSASLSAHFCLRSLSCRCSLERIPQETFCMQLSTTESLSKELILSWCGVQPQILPFLRPAWLNSNFAGLAPLPHCQDHVPTCISAVRSHGEKSKTNCLKVLNKIGSILLWNLLNHWTPKV